MAENSVKISELPALATPSSNDVYIMNSASGTTSKCTAQFMFHKQKKIPITLTDGLEAFDDAACTVPCTGKFTINRVCPNLYSLQSPPKHYIRNSTNAAILFRYTNLGVIDATIPLENSPTQLRMSVNAESAIVTTTVAGLFAGTLTIYGVVSNFVGFTYTYVPANTVVEIPPLFTSVLVTARTDDAAD